MSNELTIYILVHDNDSGTDVYAFLSSKEQRDKANEIRVDWAKENDIQYKDMDDLAEKYGDYSQDWLLPWDETFTSNVILQALKEQHAQT